jgi:hypothetical protein
VELRNRLLRAATVRPGVLLAVSPGATRERLFVEAELQRRGWPCVAGPATADLLVRVGEPTTTEDDWAERLWLGIPAPKARVTVRDVEQAADALDRGHAALVTGPHEHHQNPGPAPESGPSAHGDHDSHGGHEMAVVAGLPMADRADDRDGLRLDRLHVPLGPVLPDWPAGLVFRLELQGDVVQRAAVEQIAAPACLRPPFWNEPWLHTSAGEGVTRGDAARRLCAAHLDSLGRFLAVAGWDDAAAGARYGRDRALTGVATAELQSFLRPLIRRVRRSRTLRWLTAGLGVLSSEHAHHFGVTGPALLADGDVHSRMLVWLDGIERSAGDCDDPGTLGATALAAPRGRIDGPTPPSEALMEVLPGLLEGAEFACARLIVASLDPDLDEFTWTPRPARGPDD